MRVSLSEGKLRFNNEYRCRERLKDWQFTKYDKKSDDWHAPLTWATLVQANGIFGTALEFEREVSEWLWNEHDYRVRPAQEARERALNPETVGVNGDTRMRPYQSTAVDFLVLAQNAILADDRRLGKSFISLRTCLVLEAFPVLIIAPKSVKAATWGDEISKWYPDVSYTIVPSGGVAKTKALKTEPDIMVVNFEQTMAGRVSHYGSIRLTDKDREEGPLNREWGTVIVDEAHRIKDPHNKTTRAIWAIGEKAEHRFALSGTVSPNNPGDLWALLHFISPEEWPSKTAFIDRYCEVSFGYHGGIEFLGLKNKDELFRIIDCRLLRRTKELVKADLPPKIYQRFEVEMAPKQKAAYTAMKKDQVSVLEDGNLVAAFDPLTVRTRLGQFAKAYCTVKEDGRIVMSMPSSTVDAVVEIANEITPLVVFSASKQLVNLADEELKKKGFTTARITGDETELRRQDSKDRFNSGEAQVMLCTLGAGSEGLNLSKGQALVFMMRNYSAIHNPQAEDRIVDMDDDREQYLIIDIITPDTVDEDIVPVLDGKYEMQEEILRDRDALRKRLAA